ncbi:hypothetical protein B0T13DRAFT_231861 [Neurospora crassa]|nr:hypothetical protein B0T13DRAFT_231861 [Neurospora crassa]
MWTRNWQLARSSLIPSWFNVVASAIRGAREGGVYFFDKQLTLTSFSFHAIPYNLLAKKGSEEKKKKKKKTGLSRSHLVRPDSSPHQRQVGFTLSRIQNAVTLLLVSASGTDDTP